MYQLDFTQHFSRRYQKLTKKNLQLKEQIAHIFECLAIDPFSRNLETHKVKARHFGVSYSSTVTSNIRIIWNFNPDDKIRLLLLDLGGHSRKRGVY